MVCCDCQQSTDGYEEHVEDDVQVLNAEHQAVHAFLPRTTAFDRTFEEFVLKRGSFRRAVHTKVQSTSKFYEVYNQCRKRDEH